MNESKWDENSLKILGQEFLRSLVTNMKLELEKSKWRIQYDDRWCIIAQFLAAMLGFRDSECRWQRNKKYVHFSLILADLDGLGFFFSLTAMFFTVSWPVSTD